LSLGEVIAPYCARSCCETIFITPGPSILTYSSAKPQQYIHQLEWYPIDLLQKCSETQCNRDSCKSRWMFAVVSSADL
jgi:hypothetical protein